MHLDSEYPKTNSRNEYKPGYDPAEHFATELNHVAWGAPTYVLDCWYESYDYWMARGGHPLPDQRMWKGKMRLGRFVDPAEAQAIMRQRTFGWWSGVYAIIWSVLWMGIGGFIAGAMSLPPALGYGPIVLLDALILGIGFRGLKGGYNEAFWAQKQALKTKQPVWIPYRWMQLHNIRTKGEYYTWP